MDDEDSEYGDLEDTQKAILRDQIHSLERELDDVAISLAESECKRLDAEDKAVAIAKLWAQQQTLLLARCDRAESTIAAKSLTASILSRAAVKSEARCRGTTGTPGGWVDDFFDELDQELFTAVGTDKDTELVGAEKRVSRDQKHGMAPPWHAALQSDIVEPSSPPARSGKLVHCADCYVFIEDSKTGQQIFAHKSTFVPDWHVPELNDAVDHQIEWHVQKQKYQASQVAFKQARSSGAKRCSLSGFAGSLVQQVKRLQKTSEAAATAWQSVCKAEAQGTLDPGKHSDAFIRRFLKSIGVSAGTPASQPSDQADAEQPDASTAPAPTTTPPAAVPVQPAEEEIVFGASSTTGFRWVQIKEGEAYFLVDIIVGRVEPSKPVSQQLSATIIQEELRILEHLKTHGHKQGLRYPLCFCDHIAAQASRQASSSTENLQTANATPAPSGTERGRDERSRSPGRLIVPTHVNTLNLGKVFAAAGQGSEEEIKNVLSEALSSAAAEGTVSVLKGRLRQLKLPVSGTKATLVSRIKEASICDVGGQLFGRHLVESAMATMT